MGQLHVLFRQRVVGITPRAIDRQAAASYADLAISSSPLSSHACQYPSAYQLRK